MSTSVFLNCSECGIEFALPSFYQEKRQSDHKTFYCPNGHSQYYPQESEAEKYKRLLETERSNSLSVREKLVAAERAEKRAKNEAKRLKARAAAGVCPCCNRTVSQLARHMESKHKGFMELQGLAPRKQLAGEVTQ